MSHESRLGTQRTISENLEKNPREATPDRSFQVSGLFRKNLKNEFQFHTINLEKVDPRVGSTLCRKD